MEHLDLELADGLSALFDSTTNFGKEVDRRRLGFGKDIDVIGGHTLLSDEYLLRPVDNKVTSRVIRAFVQIIQVLIL